MTVAAMTKAQFLAHVKALYVVGNLSDSNDSEAGQTGKPDWVVASMASSVCSRLDNMLHDMTNGGALTAEEVQSFYDGM